jgi:cytochrome oxidase assembly protein ShyY1
MTEEEEIRLPIVYIGTEDVPVALANQFVIQHQQNEFILTVGQIAPPILLGTDEERREQAKNVAYVPVKVVGRFTFTRQRLAELINVLQTHLRKYDEEQGGQR